MPSVAFDLRDYSTRRRIRPPRNGRDGVILPKRSEAMGPVPPLPYSSTTLDDPRNFFSTALNSLGDVVVPDVPTGAYSVRFDVPDYVARSLTNVPSPMPEPLQVLLHRDSTFSFSPEDTVIRGELQVADRTLLDRYEVVLLQDPEPGVPIHRVPVTARGDFVLFVPEKRASTVVTLSVDFDGASTGVVSSVAVTVHRAARVPIISIP